MFYYAQKATGRPAPSSDVELNSPDLIAIPSPAVNQYQVWDGVSWKGSEKNLEERYRDFRVMMLNTSGWQKMRDTGAISMLPEFMGAISYMEDNPAMVKVLWNAIVALLPSGTISAEDIEGWIGVVEETEIGFWWIGNRDLAFDITSEGLMV